MSDRPWNNGDPKTPWSVTAWGSHPDEGNDDCWQGGDYATEAEARTDFILALTGTGLGVERGSTAYVMLDGPGVCEVAPYAPYHTSEAKRRRARQERADRAAERNERAMQHGMAFGCDGYNDAMGY